MLIEKLPIELQKYIFTFFNRKELQTIALVNKNFNKLRHEEIARLKKHYQNNFFYTVGKSIHISKPKWFYEMDSWIRIREKIPEHEIYDSFVGSKLTRIRLFKTEHEALEYSRFLRTGDQLNGTEVYQPAIFKVIYLGESKQLKEHSRIITINPNKLSLATDWRERKVKVTYLYTHRCNVIPVQAVLKIHLSEIGLFAERGIIDYTNNNLSNKKTANLCIIS